MSLGQLLAVDVIMWTDMLSSAVGLVERKEGGYQVVAGDEKMVEVGDEKMEV